MNNHDSGSGRSGREGEHGGNGKDILVGTNADDVLNGRNGTDVIIGKAGNDKLYGGNGKDLLIGGEGSDLIDGGRGKDAVVYQRRLENYSFIQIADGSILVTDLINGDVDTVSNTELFVFKDAILAADSLPFAAVLEANDQGGFDIELNDAAVLSTSLGSAGVDNVTYGGTEDIVLPDNVENVSLTGTADISASGNDGDNTLIGNDGANTLSAGDGNDIVDGGAGNDTLVGGSGAGDDTYIGGLGEDTVVYSSATLGITVDLAAGTASGPEIGNDTLIEIENVVGGSGNDIIRGDTGDNKLYGGDGDDLLTGGLGGNDLFDGGNGLDRVSFSGAANSVNVQLAAGTATIGAFSKTFAGIELVRGTSQNDTFNALGFSGTSANAGSNGTFNEFEGLGGNDVITGNGNTRVSYLQAAAGVNVNLANGIAFGMTPDDAAGIGTDNILSGVNAVRGSEFDDELRGSTGNDTLLGGAGNDFLGGGAGSDTLNGGAGFDTASYGMASGPVTADLVDGTAIAGSDTDTLISIEALNGSAFNDVLRGNGGTNTLNGNDGNDFLIGRAGNDVLNGGNGIDTARFFGDRSAYTLSAGQVSGPDGTDTTNSVELLQFDNAYVLGYGLTPINISNVPLIGGMTVYGRAVSDSLTIGLNGQGRLIDLGGDNDTLTIGLGGPGGHSINLNVANVENIGTYAFTGSMTLTMAAGSILNGTIVDLGSFSDTLNLADGDNWVTTRGVETINAFGTGNDTVNIEGGVAASPTGPAIIGPYNVNLGGGANVINLEGEFSDFSLALSGANLTVNGRTTGAAAGNENVSLSNVQAGTTFDLGAGYDTLLLFGDGFATNDVTVQNVEEVTAVGFYSDTITIAGISDSITTVTAAGGADIITASGGYDHFRFTSIGDSSYDVPFAGQRDIVIGFDASMDAFVFDGITVTDFQWELVNFGGVDIVLVDVDGGGTLDADEDGMTGDYAGFEMAIQVDNLTGPPLSNANFWIL